MMVPGNRLGQRDPASTTAAVTLPMARARQSQLPGASRAAHQSMSPWMPSSLGIWLPMMISPTPVR